MSERQAPPMTDETKELSDSIILKVEELLQSSLRSLLLHGLMFGKSQAHSLSRLDEARRTIFGTSNFSLVQRLATK